jgi:hypothetical protein
MSVERRARMVLPVWKILLMHLPFRFNGLGGPGFAPGLRAVALWLLAMSRSTLFDRDTLKYLVVRVRQLR